jgi:hypothetical protein
MAAKAPAKSKAAKAAKVTAKSKATPKGLVLSTAQWKAYDKAYNAAASAARTRIAFRAASNRYRAYRLGSAHASMKVAAASRRAAQAGAVAANATRMSYVQSRLGHQNAALQSRIENDMYTHANTAGRLQYVQAGEAAYAHRAIMRTVDEAQANAHEKHVFETINKTAKKAAKSTLNTRKKTTLSNAQSAAVAKAGSAAGLKAASKVKAPAQAKAKTRTAPRPAGYLQARRPGEWIGDPAEPHCVAFAVANHLLYSRGSTGVSLTPAHVGALAERVGPEPTIEETLWQAWLTGWPNVPQERPVGGRVRLAGYRQVPYTSLVPLVVGYETEWGDHAALSLPSGDVVSWGAIEKLESPVEEAWELTWES